MRARFAKGSAAALREIVAYYQPRNRRARVTEIATGEEKKESGAAAGTGAGAGSGAGAGTGTGAGAQPRKPLIKLRWKVDNPDADALVYSLWFREESEVTWRPLGGPDPLEKTDYEWITESIADGTYRVKVVASDERANSEARRREHFLVSDPILVDNRKPDVLGIWVKGGVAAGRAVDTYSPVEQLDWALDGGPFAPLAPLDGMLDDLVEAFRLNLPKDLAPGAHTLAVRAIDAAGNVGVAQVGFRVP